MGISRISVPEYECHVSQGQLKEETEGGEFTQRLGHVPGAGWCGVLGSLGVTWVLRTGA